MFNRFTADAAQQIRKISALAGGVGIIGAGIAHFVAGDGVADGIANLAFVALVLAVFAPMEAQFMRYLKGVRLGLFKHKFRS